MSRYRTDAHGNKIKRNRGRSDRPSRQASPSIKSPDYNQSYGPTYTARVEADGILRECCLVEAPDPIYGVAPATGAPKVGAYARLGLSHTRQSLTKNLHLGLLPVKVELEARPTKQLDKHTPIPQVEPIDLVVDGTKTLPMVSTSDQRVTWRSDKSLLTPGGKPEITRMPFKRLTSQSKRIVSQREQPEEVLATDDLTLDGMDLYKKPKPRSEHKGTWDDPIPNKPR